MINAAIVGLGWWGREHVASLDDSTKMRIVRAVDPSLDAAREFCDARNLPLSPDYDDVLADEHVDAVILATPHTLHSEQIIAAARAGKHVFTEKPFAMSRADAERQVAACRKAEIVLGIGLIQRFADTHRRIKAMLDAGELGSPMHGEANISHDVLLNVQTWRKSSHEAPAGGITHTGTHMIDLFIWMLGRVTNVFGQIQSNVFENDTASALLIFENGRTAYLGDVMATAELRYFHLFGSEGWVRREGEDLMTFRTRGEVPHSETVAPGYLVRRNNEAFADAVAGLAPYPISTDEMIHNVAVLEAIVKSMRTGQSVTVD